MKTFAISKSSHIPGYDDRVLAAVDWAINIANDDSYGYSQDSEKRWNQSFDCSSLVIRAFRAAGFRLSGATYTGNMWSAFKAEGFSDVIGSINIATGAGLMKGDILLNSAKHTAIYIGDGKIVHASRDEKGGITGAKDGDQDGGEICIRSYYNKPWNRVIRYGNAPSETNNSTNEGGTCQVDVLILKRGMKDGVSKHFIKSLQLLLNGYGFRDQMGRPLIVDGDFGSKTEYVVRQYQSRYNLEVDGIVGAQTWAKLLGR